MGLKQEPSQVLTEVVSRLSLARGLGDVTEIVTDAARKLVGSDGSTFVLRDADKCYYVDENAISPMWKGLRFPLEACISGWSMLHREIVVIPDIYQDARIPHEAYRPTFVKSLCMVPIRSENPLGSIGNYWANGQVPGPEDVKLLQILANSSAVALENLGLKQELRKRVDEAETAQDLRSSLEAAIHTLAHDLRSPLASIIGCAELLQMNLEKHLDPKNRGYFESLIRTGMNMNEQIQRMLTLYSVTRRDLEKASIDLAELGREISQALKAQAASRQVEFEIEPCLPARADPVLMRMALENLMSNAWKYTSKKSSASIRLGKLDGGDGVPTFYVRDNGAGFESSQAGRLFRPLARLHSDAEFKGTGLGLASVARIIQLHGGSIWAEGKKNEGATFYFSLPPAGEPSPGR